MPEPQHDPNESSMLETLQSLIVAFVLAMTFRGFVTEGFVIPTGSMAPTLKGQHLLMRSELTGWEYAVGLDMRQPSPRLERIADPMIGRDATGTSEPVGGPRRRMGDRILVLKCLYPFSEPDRFDIVVFKNPTDPNGEAGNYIKRLIGLPNEKIWLADGDVFVGSAADPENRDDYQIQRKPIHVQRAVWQPVFQSDFSPIRPDDERLGRSYRGAPWRGESWDTTGISYRCETAERTTLEWQGRDINDWTPYNVLTTGSSRSYHFVSDVRVAAALIPDDAGLVTTFELQTRGVVLSYTLDLGAGEAVLAMRDVETDIETARATGTFRPARAGAATDVEFWHVDQAMAIHIGGRRVVELPYDWKPVERVERAVDASLERWDARFPFLRAHPPVLRWHFSGSALRLDRMSLDRDLFYLPTELRHTTQLNGPVISGHAFGTHPDSPAILQDDQFFMLGDNSPASSDSRLWGNPHPLVASQIDPSPFVVNRKLLLGKAWVVYFPAPFSVSDDGMSIIPDLGRLRFIR